VTPEKWNVYLSICRKVETAGAGDDVSRDPRDLAMQHAFIDRFGLYLHPVVSGRASRVLAPGAVSEAVMLAEAGYETHALVLGRDNAKWLEDHRPTSPAVLIAREMDAHDLDYPESFFDGYFTVQVHEHWISPYVHIGEVRHCLRDGGVVFVDAAGTVNPAMRQIWHTNLVPEQQVREQWEYWGFSEVWRGSEGDERPQFIFEKLPISHPAFTNSGYIEHMMQARAAL
jgi:SAM-dependent methyltransferase